MSMEPEGTAEEFFNQLESDEEMQRKIRRGIEDLAKDVGYELTEEELTAELRKRWENQGALGLFYSEPPGF
jgi:hypothetical protein